MAGPGRWRVDATRSRSTGGWLSIRGLNHRGGQRGQETYRSLDSTLDHAQGTQIVPPGAAVGSIVDLMNQADDVIDVGLDEVSTALVVLAVAGQQITDLRPPHRLAFLGLLAAGYDLEH